MVVFQMATFVAINIECFVHNILKKNRAKIQIKILNMIASSYGLRNISSSMHLYLSIFSAVREKTVIRVSLTQGFPNRFSGWMLIMSLKAFIAILE
jgi:hypothetical protein